MAGKIVLIVDDNVVNLKILRALLSKDDYELIAASTGQETLDMLRSNPNIDLVLLDVVLPDISGIEVCRILKSDPNTAHIPVILISAHRTDDASINNGLEVGAEGYLIQPIEDVVLRTWVRTVLRIRELQKEHQKRLTEPLKDDIEILQRLRKLAHAVNNPLQSLYAAADMLSLKFHEDRDAQQLITEILANAEKVAQLVGEASTLARQRLQQISSA